MYRYLVRLLVLLVGMLLTWSCKSGLSENLNGLPCDANQHCVDGYTCDLSSNSCHPTLTCREGETVCGAACVVLKNDSKNCGGCGATCTAPEHAQPGCAGSRCGFSCDEGYFPCGTVCVNFADDPDNCGGCGEKCS